MVGVGIEVIVIVILLIFSILLSLEGRYSARNYLDDYDAALEEMKYSLDVVAQVLHKLPEMVPQFSLVNENPLSQILQFFQQMHENKTDPSLDAARLRDGEGRFTEDGTKEKEEDFAT